VRQEEPRQPPRRRPLREEQQDGIEGRVEERRRQATHVQQTLVAAEQAYVEGARRLDPRGDRQRRDADAQLEERVDEEGALDAGRQASRDRSPGGQAGHIGGEHGRDGEVRGAEDEGELACPGRLVDQARQPRQEKAQEDQRKGGIARHRALEGSVIEKREPVASTGIRKTYRDDTSARSGGERDPRRGADPRAGGGLRALQRGHLRSAPRGALVRIAGVC